MQAESREESDRLLSLFWTATADYACVLLSRAGIVIGWKGAANNILGYSESEVLGKSIDLIFTDEDQQRGQSAFERQMAAANGRAEDDRWHLRKDGSRIWVSGALLALRDNDS